MSLKTRPHSPSTLPPQRERDEARCCANCLAWTAPELPPHLDGESDEQMKARFANKGVALPKGLCRRYPKSEPKDGADWCLEHS